MHGTFPEERFGVTASEFAAELAGEYAAIGDAETERFSCDWCAKGVPWSKNAELGMYMADRVLVPPNTEWEELGRLASIQSYCEECATDRLLFPCAMASEVRVRFRLTDDGRFADVRVTDGSPRGDGIDWDPHEVPEKITRVEASEFFGRADGRDMTWAPEAAVTFFLSVGAGIDIRELIQWDGSFNPSVLGDAREAFREYVKQRKASGGGRETFRDHVRGQ